MFSQLFRKPDPHAKLREQAQAATVACGLHVSGGLPSEEYVSKVLQLLAADHCSLTEEVYTREQQETGEPRTEEDPREVKVRSKVSIDGTLSCVEAAEALGVNRATVHNMIKRQDVNAISIPGSGPSGFMFMVLVDELWEKVLSDYSSRNKRV